MSQQPAIQNYQPTRKIRTVGSYYVVYEATQAGLNRPVELRILTTKVKQDSDEFRRFSHEFKTLAQLDHPNIIRVLDLGLVQNHVFYVTDLRPARSLAEMLADPERDFSIRDILVIFRSIASALAHLHKRDILHRDISEATVFLDRETRIPYIAEFSMVKNFGMEDLSAIGIRQMSSIITSPEILSGKPMDQRTDVYLLGRLTYKMLTHRKQKEGVTLSPAEVERAKTHPRVINEDVPPEFDDIVAKCLEPDPAQRFQSANELLERLEETEQKLSVKFALSRLAESTQSTLMRGSLNRQQKQIERARERQTQERHTRRIQQHHDEIDPTATPRKTMRYDMADATEEITNWAKKYQTLLMGLFVALVLGGVLGFNVWERSQIMSAQSARTRKSSKKEKVYDENAKYDEQIKLLASTVKSDVTTAMTFSDRWYLLKEWVAQLVRDKAKTPMTMQEVTEVRKVACTDEGLAYKQLDDLLQKAGEHVEAKESKRK